MKKTISLTALAISASSSFAFIGGPMPDSVHKTYCLSTYSNEDGSAVAIGCDESANNQSLHLVTSQNGCTEGQVALTTSKSPRDRNFPITINACLPPNASQL